MGLWSWKTFKILYGVCVEHTLWEKKSVYPSLTFEERNDHRNVWKKTTL